MPDYSQPPENISAAEERLLRKKNKRRKVILIVVAALTVLVLVGTLVVYLLLNSRIFQSGEEDLNSEINHEDAIKDDVIGLLICGIDDEEGRGMGQRTDLILYACFDVKAGEVNVLQIPRDTYIESTSTNKINAVYGQTNGVAGLAKEINELFALPVDHYATIKMDGFKDLVDALGGVTMNVPYDYDWGGGLSLKAGQQKLDGAHAEIVVRHRGQEGSSTGNYSLGDISRLKIQRLFIAAFLEQLLTQSKIDLIGLVPTFQEYVSTDLTPAEMMGLMSIASGLKMDDMVMHLLPGEGIPPSLANYSIHLDRTAELLNTYFRPYSAKVPPEDLNCVEVVNNYDGLDDDQGNLGEIVGGSSGSSDSSTSKNDNSSNNAA